MKEKEGRWSSMALRKGIRSLHNENWPLHCHCRMSVSPRLHRNMSLPRDFPHISHIGTQQPEGTQKLSVRGARQVCISQIWLQAEQFLLGCLISNSCQILSVLPISRHLLVFHFWCEDFFIISRLQHGMLQLSLKGCYKEITELKSQVECQQF